MGRQTKSNSKEDFLDNLCEDFEKAVIWGVPIGLFVWLASAVASYNISKHYLYPVPRKDIVAEKRINTFDIISTQEGKGSNAVKYNDYRSFSSLDEIVKIEDGRPVILKVGNRDFNEYLRNWEINKKPIYGGK